MTSGLSAEDKIEMILRLANSWQPPGQQAEVTFKCTTNANGIFYEARVASTNSSMSPLVIKAPSVPELIDKALSDVAAKVSATIDERRMHERIALQHRQELEAVVLKIEADIVQRNKP